MYKVWLSIFTVVAMVMFYGFSIMVLYSSYVEKSLHKSVACIMKVHKQDLERSGKDVRFNVDYINTHFDDITIKKLLLVTDSKLMFVRKNNVPFLGFIRDDDDYHTLNPPIRRINLSMQQTICPKMTEILGMYLFKYNPYSVIKFKLPKNKNIDIIVIRPILMKTIFTDKFYILIAVSFIFFIMISFVVQYFTRKEMVLMLIGKESKTDGQYMGRLSENMHHEVNTPLAIIISKFTSYTDTVKRYEKEINDEDATKLNDDARIIASNVRQIQQTVDNTAAFRHAKNIDNDKNLYETIEVGLNGLKVFYKNQFTFTITDDLKKYGLPLKSGLKNGDLVNVIYNIVKNSLEAKASIIEVQMVDIDEDTIQIGIIDNGHGIKCSRGALLPKKHWNKIFEQHYTSKGKKLSAWAVLMSKMLILKPTDLEIRGIGMYLNRALIQKNNGDIYVDNSDETGTTIAITLKVRRNDENGSAAE